MDSSFFVDSERPKKCFDLIRRYLVNSGKDVKGSVVYTGLCQNLAMFFRLPKFAGLEKVFAGFCLSKFRPLFAKSGVCSDCLGDAYESPSQFVNLLLRRCYPPDVAKFLSKRGYRLVALDFIHYMEDSGRFTDFVFPYSFLLLSGCLVVVLYTISDGLQLSGGFCVAMHLTSGAHVLEIASICVVLTERIRFVFWGIG